MIYEKDLKEMWDEYAIKKTIEEVHREEMERATAAAREKALEEGVEKGAENTKREFVKNLLDTGKFSVAEIANYASVSEVFVRNVKKRNVVDFIVCPFIFR